MKKTVNKKLSIKELEKRTNILMEQIIILQDMVDIFGQNLISYIRFKKDEKGFMDFIKKAKKESKPKSEKTATKRKINN